MENHHYRGRLSESMQRAHRSGRHTHSGRISLCSATMHNSVLKAAGLEEGRKGVRKAQLQRCHQEDPPKPGGLGGIGALSSGREEEVEIIRQFMCN